MAPELFGIEHILYIIITTIICGSGLLIAYKYAKTDKLKSIIDTQVHEMNGRVLIPSFAQSRVQQLALMIYQLYKNEEWQPKV